MSRPNINPDAGDHMEDVEKLVAEELERAIILAENSESMQAIMLAAEIRRLRRRLGEVEYEYNVLEIDLEDGEECIFWDWGTFEEAWRKAVSLNIDEQERVDRGYEQYYTHTVIKRRKAGDWERL